MKYGIAHRVQLSIRKPDRKAFEIVGFPDSFFANSVSFRRG